MDERSSYPDGSLRFAIFSLPLPAGSAGQVVSLAPGAAPGGPAVDPASWLNAGHDVRVLAESLLAAGLHDLARQLQGPDAGNSISGRRDGDGPSRRRSGRHLHGTRHGKDRWRRLQQLAHPVGGAGPRDQPEHEVPLLQDRRRRRLRHAVGDDARRRRSAPVHRARGDEFPGAGPHRDHASLRERPSATRASARAMLGRSSPHAWLSGTGRRRDHAVRAADRRGRPTASRG